jgi:carbamoyl-phosphate synthase small subunit
MDAYLALETGEVIVGRGRASGTATGEVVFTTAYTGYEESLTDPSYAEQILTFAYPLIGNYGVRADRFESTQIQPTAAVANEFTAEVVTWFDEQGVPAMDHLDTRALVTTIRDEGAMRAAMVVGDDVTAADATAALETCVPMSAHTDIGAQVTTPTAETVGDGDIDVALIDCGAKGSIVDALVARGATVHRLPYDTDAATVADLDPDVLFISNGPGDPRTFTAAEALVGAYAGETPIAGICLGQQIVANALGGTTAKMTFGHRGVNQPVLDLATDTVIMTTQNHGYTVDEPGDTLAVTQVNVNDETAEGLANDELQILTRQYHPEAHPGPNDSLGFFDAVLAMAR